MRACPSWLVGFLVAGYVHPPCAAVSAADEPDSPRIPLCRGLTIVGAVREPRGDYEPILQIESVDGRAVHAKYSTNEAVGGAVRHVTVSRTVLTEDLSGAALLVNWFNPRAPITIPGSTAFSTSRAVLRSLKTTGTAELSLVERGDSAMPANPDVHPNIYDFSAIYKLQRVGSGPIVLPVTVNGSKVDLPVIQARGEHMGATAQFYFLDDDSNPLSLKFQFTPFGSAGPDTQSQVVKITHRCSETASATPVLADRLERALAETGRADVYDVYFDFNSDRIREESEPTLEEIAEVLRRHPDWNLVIEGHTDNVGSDVDNLDLSKRRAASVKEALVANHGVGADRLRTGGYGEARPRDRNDTLDGRARNRRVELVRSDS
jgi:outer membrane protein OmpA-like peptidoglycan-associated protein